MTELDKDNQFYRDTESIAFPKLDDRQLAMLEPLGARRKLRRGEVLFIDVRKMGVLVTRVHRELTDEEIARIGETYHAWRGE